MKKPKDLGKLFDHARQYEPLSVFKREYGYLKLTEEQKTLIRPMTFTPGKHIFATITGPDGIQCLEADTDHPRAFDRFVEEHEKKSMAYAYLGVSDEKGRVEVQDTKS